MDSGKSKILNRIVDILLSTLYSFSLVYALESSLLLDFSKLKILGIIVLFHLIYLVISINRLTNILSLTIIGCGLAGGVAYLIYSNGIGRAIGFCEDYFYWLNRFILFADRPNPLFSLITVVFLCFAISCVIYLLSVRIFAFILLLTAGVALFCIQWINYYTTTLAPFYIFLFVVVLFYIKHTYLKKSAKDFNQYIGYGRLLLFVTPLAAMLVLSSLMFKFSEKPIEWKWLDEKIPAVSEFFENTYNHAIFKNFSLASTGFSRNSELLGGRVSFDDTPVLKVKSQKNIYLRGTVLDVYTGNRWLESDAAEQKLPYSDETAKNHLLDTFIINSIIHNLSPSLPQYCSRDTITIQFERLKTNAVFVPVNYLGIYRDSPQKIVLDGLLTGITGSVLMETRKSNGFTYNVDTYILDYSNKDLIAILRRCSNGFFEKLIPSNLARSSAEKFVVPIRIPGHNTTHISIKEFMNRAEYIRGRYLQLPENLPKRVKDLSLSLTNNYKNDYDKAKAIERFLSTTFPYTLEPGSLPRGRDFVDYFLFDQREGYCTYYASAMVVLARCAGIPARYIEGYMLPAVKDSSGYYTVTNNNAHAWVEIFLEGFGWVPFEPTGAFTATFYSNDSKEETVSETQAFNTDYEEYERMLQENNEQYYSVESLPELAVITRPPEKFSILPIIIFSASAVFAAFVILNIVNIFRHKSRIRRINKMPPRESVLEAYKYYLQVLNAQKLSISSGETVFAYSGRIDNELIFTKPDFKTVSGIFAKARYSNNDISDSDKKTVYAFCFDLLDQTLKNIGKLKFYFKRNILGQL